MSAPYVQTFTPVIGSLACNAKCPYCCSRMTCTYGMNGKEPEYKWKTFNIAAQIARERNCVTAFVTSKGEPTLFPDTVSETIERLKHDHRFPIIELQTNGILLKQLAEKGWLKDWSEKGLNLVCLSTVHWEKLRNQEIYGGWYPELEEMIKVCAENDIKVRASCVMLKGYVDNITSIMHMRRKLTEWGASQFVARPVSAPWKCCNKDEAWRLELILDNRPDKENQEAIFRWLEENCSAKRNLAHGAKVYSVQLDQGKPEVNICLSNCFTPPTKDEEIRQIIWLPDGTITDNWDHEGLVIL